MIGIVGAFAAGGVVIGLARTFVSDLGGGDSGYGVLFGAVFAGLGLGMWRGPRLLQGLSRRRLFGIALTLTGVLLFPLALVQQLPVVVGARPPCSASSPGVGWITGNTMLGLEVPDEVRGRTFAFVGSMIRLALALVLAVAPLLAGLIGTHDLGPLDENGDPYLVYNGAAFTFLIAAVLMTAVGVASYRQMDDRNGASADDRPAARLHRVGGRLLRRPGASSRSRAARAPASPPSRGGCATWLEADGYDVRADPRAGGHRGRREAPRRSCSTRRPATSRTRTEALLYAADKAEHVDRVVAPALARGAVVVTDRYVDSTLAYQGAGRALVDREVERIARWATDDLRPHLTVLLDLPPQQGLTRFEERDRIEAESVEFHERVREMFLQLAGGSPGALPRRRRPAAGRRDRRARSGARLAPAARPPPTATARAPRSEREHRCRRPTSGRPWSVSSTRSRRSRAAVAGQGMTHAWLFTGPPGSGPLQRGAGVRRGAAVRARHRLRGVPRLPDRAGRVAPRRQHHPLGDVRALHRRHARAGAPLGAGPGRSGATR